MRHRLAIPLLALGLLAGCAPAAKSLGVDDAWARPAEAGSTSAVYFRLQNGPQADMLIGVESAAGRATIHRTIHEADGIVRMEHQRQIDLPANAQVVFEPGGLHIMLLDLASDLAVGDSLEIRLMFKEHAPIDVQASVRQP